ncbi:MAG TPA: PQQ-binding-like beta-propeller repeat protein [Acidimicrobiales bacterium]
MPGSRRSRGLRAVAAVAVLSLGASGCWLQRGATAGRERYVPGDTPITPDRADDLVELWRTTGLGQGLLEPLASGDDVFAASSGGGSVSRLSASTGAVHYTVPLADPATGGPVRLSALIDNGGELRAAWGVGSATFVGGVARLAPDTGELLEPLVGGDYVPVDFAADRDELVTQAAWVVIPLGPPQGEAYVAWRGIRATFGFHQPFSMGNAAVAGDHLVWRTGATALGWNGTACTRPSRLLDGTPSCLPDWQTDVPGVSTNPTAIGTDAVAFGSGPNAVTVLDAATGAVRFTGTVPNTASSVTEAAVAGDTILVGTGDGHIVALPAGGCAPATVCAPLWQAQVGSAVYVPPTVAGDVVYVVTDDGDLVTLALHGCGAATCPAIAGYPIGVADPDSAMAPVYDDGRIFVATSDGQVVAFGL